MSDHRIRLTDSDILLIIGALLARRSGAGPRAQQQIDYLVARLGEGVRGNPGWITGVARPAPAAKRRRAAGGELVSDQVVGAHAAERARA